METLEDAIVKILELKGSQMALMTLVSAFIEVLPREAIEPLQHALQRQGEQCEVTILNASVSDILRDACSRDIALFQERLQARA